MPNRLRPGWPVQSCLNAVDECFERDKEMAQKEGLEPPTQRLTAACSTD